MPQPTTISMELKYCERCGGLHLRPHREPSPYCAPCARALEKAEEALPRPLRRGRRPLASTKCSDTAMPTDTADTGRTA